MKKVVVIGKEIEEIKHCLEQFNDKGDFIPLFNNSQMSYLKTKLKEYETKKGKQ